MQGTSVVQVRSTQVGRWRARRSVQIMVALLAVSVILAACGSSSSGSGAGNRVQARNPYSAFYGNLRKPPNLTGTNLSFTIGGPEHFIFDTTAYVALQILRAWGASTTITSVGPCPHAAADLLGGHADVALCPIQVILQSHLVIIGSNQPRASAVVVAKKTVNSMKGLVGKTVEVDNPNGAETVELAAVESHYRIAPSSIHIVVVGASTAEEGALLSGAVDAGILSLPIYLALEGRAPGQFHVLATVAKILPKIASSYIAVTNGWLSRHQKEATAIDEAFLIARRVFNKDQALWVKDGLAYTVGTGITPTFASLTWREMHAAGIWPLSDSGMGSSLAYNAALALHTGLVKSLPPASTWSEEVSWSAASRATGVR